MALTWEEVKRQRLGNSSVPNSRNDIGGSSWEEVKRQRLGQDYQPKTVQPTQTQSKVSSTAEQHSDWYDQLRKDYESKYGTRQETWKNYNPIMSMAGRLLLTGSNSDGLASHINMGERTYDWQKTRDMYEAETGDFDYTTIDGSKIKPKLVSFGDDMDLIAKYMTDPAYAEERQTYDEKNEYAKYDLLEDNQKNTFLKLWSEGREDEAKAYLDSLSRDINRKSTEANKEEFTNMLDMAYDKNVLLGDALAGFSSLAGRAENAVSGILSPATYFASNIANGTNEYIDPNDPMRTGQWMSSIASEKMHRIDTTQTRANIKGMIPNMPEETADKIANSIGTIRNFGIDLVDQRLHQNAPMLFGIDASVMFGFEALADEWWSTADQDRDPLRGLVSGAVKGVETWLTENLLGSEAWFGNDRATKGVQKFSKDWMRATLRAMRGEALEEVEDQILGTITDQLFWGSQSELKQQYDAYIENGLSEEQALEMISTTWFKEMLYSMLVAATSVGMSRSFYEGRGMINTMNLYQGEDARAQAVQEGLESDRSSQAYENAVSLREKGNDVSPWEAYRQAVYNEEAISDERAQAVKEDYKTVFGESLDDKDADILRRASTGRYVTDSEINRIVRNENLRLMYENYTQQDIDTDKSSRKQRETVKERGWAEADTARDNVFDTRLEENTDILNSLEDKSRAQTVSRQMQSYGKNAFAYAIRNRGDANIDTTTNSFMNYYNAGIQRLSDRHINFSNAVIGESMARQAYLAGRNDSRLNVANYVKTTGYSINPNPGLDRNAAKDTKLTDEDIDELDSFGKMAGLRIELVDDIRGKSGFSTNGRISTATGTMNVKKGLSADRAIAYSIQQTIAHEGLHVVRAKNPKAFNAFVTTTMEYIKSDPELRAEYNVARWEDAYKELNSSDVLEEMMADFVAQNMSINEMTEMFSRTEPSILQKVHDALGSAIEKAKKFVGISKETKDVVDGFGKVKEALRKAISSKSDYRAGNTTRYMVKTDLDGNPYVEIDADILAGIPRRDWVKTVKSYLTSHSIDMGHFEVAVNRTTRREYTNSEYTKHLPRDLYKFKMQMVNNFDEIFREAYGTKNEDAIHTNFESYNRGHIDVTFGGNDYSVEVLTGINKANREIAYDIVNITPTTIRRSVAIKNADDSKRDTRVSHSPQMGVTSAISVSNIAEITDKVNSGQNLTKDEKKLVLESINKMDMSDLEKKDIKRLAEVVYGNIVSDKKDNARSKTKTNEEIADLTTESDIVVDTSTGDIHFRESRKSFDESVESGKLDFIKELYKQNFNFMSDAAKEERANKYIAGLINVRNYIRENSEDLDYDPNRDTYEDGSFVYNYAKSNSDYGYSLDSVSNCIRRKPFQDTFSAVIKEIAKTNPDRKYNVQDYTMLWNMMKRNNYKVGCAICFVDAPRMMLGQMTTKMFRKYPNLKELGYTAWDFMTPEGQIKLKTSGVTMADVGYPDGKNANSLLLDTFIKINGSQNRPMPYEARTDYRNDLIGLYTDRNGNIRTEKVNETNNHGGLRVQSSSDMEAVNILDMMQVIYDAGALGLKMQGYSKVAMFFDVTEGTGLMGNISVFGEGSGLDANGELAFDSIQGFPIKLALKIREKNGGKQFGTCLVGNTLDHILKAMETDYIDYIIPRHRSGMAESTGRQLGLEKYSDFTNIQLDKVKGENGRWRNPRNAAERSLIPVVDDWWDYDVDGDTNSRNYLELLHNISTHERWVSEKTGRVFENPDLIQLKPKFIGNIGNKSKGTSQAVNLAYQTDDINVTYSETLPVRPGYWKTLVDTRRYDSNGKAIVQEVVRPNFNTDRILKILESYKNTLGGSHNRDDSVKEMVDLFVENYTDRSPTAEEVNTYSKNGKDLPSSYDMLQAMKNFYPDVREEVEREYSSELKDAVRKADNDQKLNVAEQSAVIEGSRNIIAAFRESRQIEGKAPVERTPKLIAVHNIPGNKLTKAIKLGGFAMPSLAVVLAEQGHYQYGENSFIFPRWMIDPSKSRYAKIYGGDAWTQQINSMVEYKLDSIVVRDTINRLQKLADSSVDDTQFGGYISNFFSEYGYGYRASEDIDDMVARAQNNYGFMARYLGEKGVKVEKQYREVKPDVRNYDGEILGYLANKFGNEWFDIFSRTAGYLNEEEKAERDRKIKDLTEDWEIFNEFDTDIRPGLKNLKIGSMGRAVYEYLHVKPTQQYDHYLTRDEVSRLVSENGGYEQFKKWVSEQFSEDLIEKAGIYNGKDPFTSIGNRRSFEALHDDLTLFNLVKALRRQTSKAEALDEHVHRGSLIARTAKEYKNLDEVRADEKRLGRLSDKAYGGQVVDRISDQLDLIGDMLMDAFDNGEFTSYDFDEAINRIAVNGVFTNSEVKRQFKRKGFTINDDVAKEVVRLMNMARNVPTGYFEAKIEDAVTFQDMAKAGVKALVPQGSKLKKQIEDFGLEVLEYTDEEDRAAKMNSEYTEGLRFSRTIDTNSKEGYAQGILNDRRDETDEEIPGSIREQGRSNDRGSIRKGDEEPDGTIQYRPFTGMVRGRSQEVFASDNEGRRIDSETSKRLAGTAILKDGKPIRLYHYSTNLDFTTFRVGDTGFHFGSSQQAYSRGVEKRKESPGVKGRTLQVFLNIKNPLDISEDIGVFTPDSLAVKLYSMGILPEGVRTEIHHMVWEDGGSYESKSARKMRDYLAELGFDGIIYNNQIEGQGKSYMALYPEQIIVVDDGLGHLDSGMTRYSRSVDFTSPSGEKVTAYGAQNKLSSSSIESYARGLVNTYGTDMTIKDVSEHIGEFYERIRTAADGLDIWSEAKDIASEILNSSFHDTSEFKADYDNLKKDVKGTVINTQSITKDDLPSEYETVGEFIRKTRDVFSFSREGGVPVDVALMEIAQRTGISTESTLETPLGLVINAVRGKLDLAKQNVPMFTGAEYTAELNVLTNDIIDNYYETPLAKKTGLDLWIDNMQKRQLQLKEELEKAKAEAKSYQKRFKSSLKSGSKKSNQIGRLEKKVEKLNSQINTLDESIKELRSARNKDVKRARNDNKNLNKILDVATTFKQWGKGERNASEFADPVIKGFVNELGKIKYRSDISRTKARKIVANLKPWYTEANLGDYFSQEIADRIDYIAERKDNTKYPDSEELQYIADVMQGIKHLYQTYDQMTLDGKKVSIRETATREYGVLENSPYSETRIRRLNWLSGRTGYGVKTTVTNAINNIIEPRVVYQMLEGFNEDGMLSKLFKATTDAETGMNAMYINMTRSFDDFFKDNKGYKKHYQKDMITVAGKQMTIGEAISLYWTANREEAKATLMSNRIGSGIVWQNANGVTQRIQNVADVEALRESIWKQFSDEDKQLARMVHEFYTVTATDIKREADERILGFTNIREGRDDYYPFVRDKNQIGKKFADAKSLMSDVTSAYNYSFNKDIKQNVTLALQLIPADVMWKDHARKMSMYSNMTEILQTWDKVLNCNLAVDENGKKTGQESLRGKLSEKWKDFSNYHSNFMQDVQNKGRGEANPFANFVRGAYATSALGFNPKVIVSQFASYPTALMYLDEKSMTEGLSMKTDFDKLDEYSPYAMARAYENGIVLSEGNISSTLGEIGNKTTAGISWMDRQTIGKLWNACQVYVRDHNGYAIGTDENYRARAELHEQICRRTQPNYSQTERSGMMRSGNEIVKSFTMFTSVPLKQLSRMVETMTKASMAQEAYKRDASSENKAKLDQAKHEAVMCQVACLLANAMYVALATLVRFALPKKDEDKELSVARFAKDTWDVYMGLIPVWKDLYGYFFNGYEINNYFYSQVNDMLETVKKLGDFKDDPYGTMMDFTSQALMFSGIPVRNFKNVIKGVMNRAGDLVGGSAAYEIAKKQKSISNTSNKKYFLQYAYNALYDGDTQSASYIIQDMRSRGYTEKEIESALKSIFAQHAYDAWNSSDQAELTKVLNAMSILGWNESAISSQLKTLMKNGLKDESDIKAFARKLARYQRTGSGNADQLRTDLNRLIRKYTGQGYQQSIIEEAIQAAM